MWPTHTHTHTHTHDARSQPTTRSPHPTHKHPPTLTTLHFQRHPRPMSCSGADPGTARSFANESRVALSAVVLLCVSVPSPSSGASQAATVAAVAAAAAAAAATRRVGFATLATERRPRADGATDGGAAAAASHSAEQARMNARRWMLRCSPPPVASRPMAREQAIISTGCPCHSPVIGSSFRHQTSCAYPI